MSTAFGCPSAVPVSVCAWKNSGACARVQTQGFESLARLGRVARTF